MVDDERKSRKRWDDEGDKGDERDRKPRSLAREFLDRAFRVFEGPVASSFIKLVATGMIGMTTLGLTAILALAGGSVDVLLSTVAMGALSTAIIWVFGGRKNQPRPKFEGIDPRVEKKMAGLKAELSKLEERLANVEVIENFESRLAERMSSRTYPEPAGETTYGTSSSNLE